ncbi:hypothetical protein QTN25_008480 [Entamoeba marina]
MNVLINTGLTLPSNYIQLANNQLIRYCPSTVDSNVHCYLNTSIWNSNFIDNNNYPIFISPHCMNSHYSNYLCHSIQNTFEVGTDSINITFADVLDTIIISEPSYNQQIINGYFNTIETTFGLNEIIESNTFISIDTSTTINTINDEIQLDLTSLISSSSSTYLLNATIIEIIDNSIVTLDYSTPYIQFINSNNYQVDLEFTQDIIGLYSENGFNINDGNTCYFAQADEIQKIDSTNYFNCEFHTPRPCQIETEYGVKGFMNSNFTNYPMIIHVNSDKTAFVFYDILRQPIEEISLLGLKQSQIENILDKRGFYCENPNQFKKLEDLFDDDFIMNLIN